MGFVKATWNSLDHIYLLFQAHIVTYRWNNSVVICILYLFTWFPPSSVCQWLTVSDVFTQSRHTTANTRSRWGFLGVLWKGFSGLVCLNSLAGCMFASPRPHLLWTSPLSTPPHASFPLHDSFLTLPIPWCFPATDGDAFCIWSAHGFQKWLHKNRGRCGVSLFCFVLFFVFSVFWFFFLCLQEMKMIL